jgi:hypothetical protein
VHSQVNATFHINSNIFANDVSGCVRTEVIAVISDSTANLARNILVASLRAGGSKNTELYGKLTYALVITFTVMAILNQLQIADELVQTIFMGVVFALSLGLGLAFGLGGKDGR